ncbi:MarR family winged helix-turn-helix transcriptional regulator [Roseomonas sp. NAR14]|uniref:MarR family winged helix-turn-helix transcriptional regulator n=1 Tax=Roseomonas acroporae TaxID=2937791 RepID=A0A9X1Y5F1_9PROT|nr:MarR family winged helix-turn-helix transcriptional regulator [Roseomonas acroporae]MCK8783783.1 MarR family winged helix-turn-helix transcriptional regulator [Roseomonas acroporae]
MTGRNGGLGRAGDEPARTPQAVPEAALGVPDPADALLSRPGFLVRRLHQIHSAMFAEECAAYGVTPVQYSLMTLLEHAPGIDQGRAAAGLSLDRFTTADVVKRLETAGLLRTERGRDRRAKSLFLSRQGSRLLDEMQASAQRAHDRLVEGLPPRQREQFVRNLRRLVDLHGAAGDAAPRIR